MLPRAEQDSSEVGVGKSKESDAGLCQGSAYFQHAASPRIFAVMVHAALSVVQASIQLLPLFVHSFSLLACYSSYPQSGIYGLHAPVELASPIPSLTCNTLYPGQ